MLHHIRKSILHGILTNVKLVVYTFRNCERQPILIFHQKGFWSCSTIRWDVLIRHTGSFTPDNPQASVWAVSEPFRVSEIVPILLKMWILQSNQDVVSGTMILRAPQQGVINVHCIEVDANSSVKHILGMFNSLLLVMLWSTLSLNTCLTVIVAMLGLYLLFVPL